MKKIIIPLILFLFIIGVVFAQEAENIDKDKQYVSLWQKIFDMFEGAFIMSFEGNNYDCNYHHTNFVKDGNNDGKITFKCLYDDACVFYLFKPNGQKISDAFAIKGQEVSIEHLGFGSPTTELKYNVDVCIYGVGSGCNELNGKTLTGNEGNYVCIDDNGMKAFVCDTGSWQYVSSCDSCVNEGNVVSNFEDTCIQEEYKDCSYANTIIPKGSRVCVGDVRVSCSDVGTMVTEACDNGCEDGDCKDDIIAKACCDVNGKYEMIAYCGVDKIVPPSLCDEESTPSVFCGNGVCEEGETINSCPEDCKEDKPIGKVCCKWKNLPSEIDWLTEEQCKCEKDSYTLPSFRGVLSDEVCLKLDNPFDYNPTKKCKGIEPETKPEPKEEGCIESEELIYKNAIINYGADFTILKSKYSGDVTEHMFENGQLLSNFQGLKNKFFGECCDGLKEVYVREGKKSGSVDTLGVAKKAYSISYDVYKCVDEKEASCPSFITKLPTYLGQEASCTSGWIILVLGLAIIGFLASMFK